jgi:D(-)-tartrate dehydratase
MRIVDIKERAVPISRYADPAIPSGGLTTSIVAVITDVMRGGRPVVGYGFSSIGRFAQSGLIKERFAPRLLAANDLSDRNGTNIDPFRCWESMMSGEKPGGHGERCVAVGTLDMAIWDAAAKIAGAPLYHHLAATLALPLQTRHEIPVYAGGGYYYPTDDIAHLTEEIRRCRGLGFTRLKIKIGGETMARDVNRIEAAIKLLATDDHLAVDAMNSYDADNSVAAAAMLAPYDLWWFEDICDPLDLDTLAAVASTYRGCIGAGEALFSTAEAKLLDRHGGLRRNLDALQFDPVHCYGIAGYLQIIDYLESRGWKRTAFWPHGGHLFCLHVVAALGLGGAECNPLSFQPFGGYADGTTVMDGFVAPPDSPGIGFETRKFLNSLFQTLLDP